MLGRTPGKRGERVHDTTTPPARPLPRPIAPAAVLRRAATASRSVLAAVTALALVATLLGVTDPGSLPAGLAPAVAVVGLVLGLPHGAVDHVLAARLTGWPLRRLLPAYVATAVVTWLLLATLGLPALLLVLAVSFVHFAAGEVEVARAAWAWPLDRRTAWALGVSGTGALLLPLARSDAAWRDVATAISPDLAALIAEPALRAAVAAVWVAAAGLTIVAGLRARRPGPVLDVLVLLALALLLPPLAAFGLWFGVWHGGRHLARLLAEEEGSARHLATGRPAAAVRHLAAVAAWPTLAALAVAAAGVVATTGTGRTDQALAPTVQVLLALTVPHMLVVLGLDRRSRRG